MEEKKTNFFNTPISKIIILFVASLLIAVCASIACCLLWKVPDNIINNQITNTTSIVIQQSTNTNSSSSNSALVTTINSILPSVVEINAKTSITATSGSAGSGVIIGQSGNDYYIITCHHVIDSCTIFSIKTTSGNTYSATLMGGDPQSDIAALKINTSDSLTLATFVSDEYDYTVGETAIVIGNPLGTLGGSVTQGIVSATERTITVSGNVMTLMQIDAAINSGNSGGALFNSDGDLMGIVNAKNTGISVDNLGFAIPAHTAKVLWEELVSTSVVSNGFGYIEGRASLQVEFRVLNFASEYTGYIYTNSVPATSDCYNKLQYGDIVKSLTINGGTAILGNDITNLNTAINSLNAGDELVFEIYRLNDNTELSITVTMSQYVYTI